MPNVQQREVLPMQTQLDLQLIPQSRTQKLLGISAMTLWRWQKQNGFPNPKVIRGRKYFRASEINSWIESQECGSSREIPNADAGRTKGRVKLAVA
jgi:predicted DNA-binding transcriptional regulator AlpA